MPLGSGLRFLFFDFWLGLAVVHCVVNHVPKIFLATAVAAWPLAQDNLKANLFFAEGSGKHKLICKFRSVALRDRRLWESPLPPAPHQEIKDFNLVGWQMKLPSGRCWHRLFAPATSNYGAVGKCL